MKASFSKKKKKEKEKKEKKKKDVCDYKVEGSWFEKSCIIYAGESSTVVAQVRSSTLKSGSRRIRIIKEPKQTDY